MSIVERDEIPQAFKEAMERPAQPPGEVVADVPKPRWHIDIDYDPDAQQVKVRYPDDWGFGDWISTLLFMNKLFGDQLIELARQLEREAKERGNG